MINYLLFTCFILFGRHIFVDNSSTSLQLQLHLIRVILKGKYLSSAGFKSKRKGRVMHGSLFKDTHFVAEHLQQLKNSVNTCLISLKIVLFCF